MDESNALIVFERKDLNGFIRKARKLAAQPEGLEEYAAKEFMEHTVLLGECAKMLLVNAPLQEKSSEALEMLKVAAKLHMEWREAMLPVTRRLWKRGGSKPNGRQAQQISTAGGSGFRATGAGRGGTPESGSDSDPEEGGGPGDVVEGSVVFPDGDGS